LLEQVDHFNGCDRGLEALVTRFETGAVQSLLDRVTGEDAEDHRDFGLQGDVGYAVGGGRTDMIVVIGVAANYRPEANDSSIFSTLGKSLRDGRNFEGAGNANDVNFGVRHAMAHQGVNRPLDQQIDDGVIEPCRHYSKATAGRREMAFDGFGH
jgi:hypothetical protein